MYKPHRTSSLVLALLAATCLTPPEGARAEPGQPLGDEFQVNSYITGDQALPAVASDTEGNFVVVWFSDQPDADVFARRFDAAGQPVGPEIPVNSITTGVQSFPAVAMDADGDFVVVWSGSTREGVGPFFYDVFARRYDAAGNPLDDAEFKVNTIETGIEAAAALPPAVAADADGDFVVAWQSRKESGYGLDIYARRYDAAGVAVTDPILVNGTTLDTHALPAVAMDADGDFVVAWQGSVSDLYLYDVFARRFNAAGEAQGSELVVNTVRTATQWYPAVSMDADGDFVVAWSGYAQDSSTGDSFGIFARRYNAAGEAQGSDFLVNTETSGEQFEAAVTLDADGDFVVAWASKASDVYADIVAQRFDAAGVPQGGEVLVNVTTSGRQRRPSLAADADGDFVVAWDSADLVSGAYDVYARRYQGAGPVPNDFTVDGRSDILWRRTDTGRMALWEMDGFATEDAREIPSPDTVWRVAGLADFNADTKTDLLWRHTGNGLAAVWLMDGFERLGAGVIGGPNLDWRIVGTGDFDGDDHADILWRNVVSGSAVVWKMDGLVKRAGAAIGQPPLDWQVVGVGDFDADATSDILWRHQSRGTTVAWKMEDLAKDSAAVVGAPPVVWQVEGLADFDADAKTDVLWRNTDNGGTVVWKMDGLAKAASSPVGAAPLVWDLEGAGDTDGGRKADILWRHATNDTVVIWKMDGFTKIDAQVIGFVSAVWEVQ